MVARHEMPGMCHPETRPVRYDRLVSGVIVSHGGQGEAPRITPFPYRWSEVIHRSGTKAGNEALERERAQIVNNFAPGASATTNNRPIR